MLKNSNGVTLISLIVTVIIVFILAGVSLNSSIGGNGLITKATEVVEKSKATTIGDEVKLEVLAAQMDLAMSSSSEADISDYSDLITNNTDYYTYSSNGKTVKFTLDEFGNVTIQSIAIGTVNNK